jgi:DNA-binding CsgD family transcriptional regulator
MDCHQARTFSAPRFEIAVNQSLRARVPLETIDLDNAILRAERNLYRIERYRVCFGGIEAAYSALVFAKYEQEGPDAALGLIVSSIIAYRRSRSGINVLFLSLLRVRTLIRCRRLLDAGHVLAKEPLCSIVADSAQLPPFRLDALLCRYHLAALTGQAAQVISHIEALRAPIAQHSDILLALRFLVVLAQALAAAGNSERAAQLAEEACALSTLFVSSLDEMQTRMRPTLLTGPVSGVPGRSGRSLFTVLLDHRKELAPNAAQEQWKRLSTRECQVLGMLSRGLSSKEISGVLSISIGTVKSYRRTLYEKLRISRRSDAVAAARVLGLSA